MTSREIMDHHFEAFWQGDVAETMKDYTEESVLITPQGTMTGLEQIEKAFDGFYKGLFKPGTYEFTVDYTDATDDVAYMAWHSGNAKVDVTMGTDTFVIRDGKIAVQTFAGKIEKKE